MLVSISDCSTCNSSNIQFHLDASRMSCISRVYHRISRLVGRLVEIDDFHCHRRLRFPHHPFTNTRSRRPCPRPRPRLYHNWRPNERSWSVRLFGSSCGTFYRRRRHTHCVCIALYPHALSGDTGTSVYDLVDIPTTDASRVRHRRRNHIHDNIVQNTIFDVSCGHCADVVDNVDDVD
jgi:hypothetical protein